MAIQSLSGTPVIGYAQLTNGAPGPTAFTLTTVMGQTAYALQTGERVYITNITVSSSDTATNLVTVRSDSGSNPTKFVSAYISASKPLQPVQIPPGICRGVFGTVPVALAAAVSTGTVEIIIKGYVSRT